MKKFFTLIVATLMASSMMAQMHGAMTFAGASSVNVLTQTPGMPAIPSDLKWQA